MSADINVSIYYGPLSWLDEQLEGSNREYLLDLVHELDESRRRIVHVVGDQVVDSETDDRLRPEYVVAESADYASMQEHAITNFVGLIRSINPQQLVLHNPPVHIHRQLDREFTVDVSRYQYPAVTLETLVQIRDGFAEHLVGQTTVIEPLLAALYPLTTGRRSEPVVLMFYGPSGVGKTETAQFVNSLLEGELMRKQFSMFHNENFASYLFGGTHSQDSFARDLLDRESGVILIDEFDKANAVFHSAFYQLFDGGVFEDKNYRVEVGPSLIICTSNYATENDINKALGEPLASRFDAMIQFKPLTKDQIRRVIDRLVDHNFNKMTETEQKKVDAIEVKDILYPISDESGNVRKLGKRVNEVISTMLVRAILNEA